MGHESYERREDAHGSSNRAFGFVFAAVFVLIALFPLLVSGGVRWWSIGVAAAFLVAALAFPAVLAPLNRLWTAFGLLLHRVVSPLVLGFMFFLVFTPMGLVRRLFNKDPLHLRFEPELRSYWVERRPPGPAPETIENQF